MSLHEPGWVAFWFFLLSVVVVGSALAHWLFVRLEQWLP